MRNLPRLLLCVLVLLLVTGVFAFGAGRLFGIARTYLFPRDASLLAYQPADAVTLGIIQVPFGRLPEGENLRRLFGERAGELEKTSGIRLEQDVDALASTDAQLWVARGRFDWARSSELLARAGFVVGESVGRKSATRSGLTLAFDGRYLVFGPSARVTSALERRDHGQGLASDSSAVEGIDAIGWRHAAVLGLAHTLSGERGRFGALALEVPRGVIDLRGLLETDSPQRAEALRAELERTRNQLLEELRRTPEAAPWVKVIEGGKQWTRGPTLLGRLQIPEPLIDELVQSAGSFFLRGELPTLSTLRSDRKDTVIPVTEAEDAAPALRLHSRVPPSPTPLLLATAFLGLLLLTVGKPRPGVLSVALSPAFAGPAFLSTVGAFFLVDLPWRTGWVGQLLTVLSLRLPDLDQALFGPSADGNPLFYSAVLPLLLSALGVRFVALRTAVASVACGFAAVLALTAWSTAPVLAWLGSPWLALPWLTVNALACLFIARAMLSASGPLRSR